MSLNHLLYSICYTTHSTTKCHCSASYLHHRKSH